MPGKTTRLKTGQYLYRTRKGDFILQRSATRRYLRGKGQRGKHVTDWTVISAPRKYRSQAAVFSEIGKSLLMDRIDELVATNYEELSQEIKRLAMEQERIANETRLSSRAYNELLSYAKESREAQEQQGEMVFKLLEVLFKLLKPGGIR